MFTVVPFVQVAYKAYTNLLPAFIQAAASNKTVNALVSQHPISWDISRCFPYTYPNLAVSFPRPPTADIMDRLKEHGFEETRIKGKHIFLFRDVNRELVSLIMAIDHDATCPAPQDAVNTSCLRAIATVRKIFSGFLWTHRYPAFIDPEHIIDVNEHKYATIPGGQGIRRPAEEPHPEGEARAQSGRQAGSSSQAMDTSTEVPAGYVRRDDAVHRCHPPQLDPSFLPWGSVDVVPPSQHGVFIPFVPELISYDKRMVVSVIVQYFLGCLGHDVASIKAAVEFLKSSFGVISQTRTGCVFAHMAACIKYGIDAQARVFPIFQDGLYEGTVLLGCGYTLIFGNESVSPVPPERLLQLLNAYRTSRSSLRAIVAMAGGEQTTDDELPEPLVSLSQLRNWLWTKSLTMEQRDDIVKLAFEVRCDTPKWAFNSASIIRAIDLVASDQEEYGNDLPIHPTMLFEEDRLSVIWSCFGDMAPTPRFPSVPMYGLSDAQLPKHVGFTQRVLSQAIADMKQVIDTKRISVPAANRRGTIHKDRIFTGAVANDVYAAFRRVANVSNPVVGTSVNAVVVRPAVTEDW